MFKYAGWFIRLLFPVLKHYFKWMARWAKHPEKIPFETRYAAGKKLALDVVKAFRINLIIENEPKFTLGERYYFVGNHTSLIDSVVVLASSPVPVTFIAKEELKKVPFIGKLMRILGGVFIERDNLKQEIKALQVTRLSLEQKAASWVVFPEGTRSRDVYGPLLPYKAGTFKAPLQTKTTIIPFVTYGGQFILPLKTRFSHYNVYVSYLNPYLISDHKEVTTQSIASYIEEDSQVLLGHLRNRYFNTIPKTRRNRKYFASLQKKVVKK